MGFSEREAGPSAFISDSGLFGLQLFVRCLRITQAHLAVILRCRPRALNSCDPGRVMTARLPS